MSGFKIVEGDNFCGDHPNEKFVNLSPTTRENAQRIADAINAAFCPDSNPHAPRHWRVEPEGYVLQPGLEP